MNAFINLNRSSTTSLRYLTQDQYRAEHKKGWSFSFVYSFTELRDVYIFLERFGFESLSKFTSVCAENALPFERTPWEKRRLLEHVNALKNFQLVSDDAIPFRKKLFCTEPGEPLSGHDLGVFRKVYFDYARFREIHSWLIDPDNPEAVTGELDEGFVVNRSSTVFPIRGSDRYVDSFIFSLEDNTTLYRISEADGKDFEGMRRFWDVYVKWGVSLGLAASYNLSDFNYKISSNFRPPSMFYFLREIDDSFNLLDYLIERTRLRYVYIPKLVLTLAAEERFPVDDIKRLIIETAQKYPEKMSLQKTSEILMRKTELGFTPSSNGFLFSHILLMK